MSLWYNNKSLASRKYSVLFDKVPGFGECENQDLEALRIMSHVYYNYYNNGCSDYARDSKQYLKKNIKSPADKFLKCSSTIYCDKKLEETITDTIKWCWERNASFQDKDRILEKPCKCGSYKHKRTNHKSCLYNKYNKKK